MADYTKPLPRIDEQTDPDSRAFWEAAGEHRLVMQRCSQCGHIRWPIGPVCTQCLAEQFEWQTLSGRGELHSWVNFYQPFHPEWAKEAPYNVSLVKLEEGPIFLSNVVECDDSELAVGAALELVWEDATDEISIPKFRPLQD
ncbi:MAG: Zn-ribbon domain-containing OB-fold protein [Dehalococcoidia bacterium]